MKYEYAIYSQSAQVKEKLVWPMHVILIYMTIVFSTMQTFRFSEN